MLQSIRNRATSWFALAILFLALFSLTFFGIGDYFTRSVDTYVAKVGDEEISANDYRERFQRWRESMRQQFGQGLDASLLDNPAMRRQVLDRMIDEAVLRQASERIGLVVPNARLRAEIADIPAFQVDGRFDEPTYLGLLAGQRMTATTFERNLRRDIEARQLPMAVMESALVTDAEVDARLRLSEQTRSFAAVRVNQPEREIDQEVTDEELSSWYDANTAEFMRPETVTVEYLIVDRTALPLAVEPSEQDLRDRYEAERARFGSPEARLVSHVLVRADGPDADAQRDALARAESIAAEARAEGADFAALARRDSTDLGSREQGGDLGWIEQGLTDPAFEEAAFALESGQVSDPVRTEDGFHVIMVREIRAATQRPFEEVREELAAEYLESERERLYNERSGELIDLVYQDPGSLQPASEALGLATMTAGPFSRQAGEGLFANPRVRDVAFSDEVLLEGNVSDPFEASPGQMVALRVVEHQRSEPRPLAEVADQARARILEARRSDAVRARAEALFAELEAGTPLADVAERAGLDLELAEAAGRNALVPEPALVAQVFRLPRPEEGRVVQRLLPLGDGHALVELTGVVDGDPGSVEESRRTQARSELEQSRANAEAMALIAGLRERTRIVVVEERMQ
ncbi:MAG: SurA N-terminal domain-containing protein [Xanthomonadales bacterium]|nr:SurA N-terminal domain-containing protein [Xanthomonadales bacterium]